MASVPAARRAPPPRRCGPDRQLSPGDPPPDGRPAGSRAARPARRSRSRPAARWSVLLKLQVEHARHRGVGLRRLGEAQRDHLHLVAAPLVVADRALHQRGDARELLGVALAEGGRAVRPASPTTPSTSTATDSRLTTGCSRTVLRGGAADLEVGRLLLPALLVGGGAAIRAGIRAGTLFCTVGGAAFRTGRSIPACSAGCAAPGCRGRSVPRWSATRSKSISTVASARTRPGPRMRSSISSTARPMRSSWAWRISSCVAGDGAGPASAWPPRASNAPRLSTMRDVLRPSAPAPRWRRDAAPPARPRGPAAARPAWSARRRPAPRRDRARRHRGAAAPDAPARRARRQAGGSSARARLPARAAGSRPAGRAWWSAIHRGRKSRSRPTHPAAGPRAPVSDAAAAPGPRARGSACHRPRADTARARAPARPPPAPASRGSSSPYSSAIGGCPARSANQASSPSTASPAPPNSARRITPSPRSCAIRPSPIRPVPPGCSRRAAHAASEGRLLPPTADFAGSWFRGG